jgi:lipid II:glycine glycyltransferase (peptidoglycan interpeptide bridge formation enzyme)
MRGRRFFVGPVFMFTPAEVGDSRHARRRRQVAHFLQSEAWARFQQSLGERVTRRVGEDWSFLGVEETQVFGPFHTKRLYAPYGPSFSGPEALQPALEQFELNARQMGDVFVRVEPMGTSPEVEKDACEKLESLGYHRVSHLLPEDTWRINVTVGRDALLKGMDKSNRKRYRQAAGKGIEIRTSTNPEDIPLLTKLMSDVEERDGITLRDTDYLKKEAASLFPTGNGRLYLAVLHERDADGNPTGEERVIAANFVFLDDDCCYLIHNGADSNYFKTGANVAMQVQIVLDAAEEGRTWCDFHGMAPEGAGPEHPWYGFTKFKQSFGGEARHYLGTWEKPIKQAHYAVYDLARKVIAHK